MLAISTSGSSLNVIEAVRTAKKKGAVVIGLSGRSGGDLTKEADISIVVRSKSTARIQEVHQTIIHALCKIIEDSLSNKDDKGKNIISG